MIKGKGVSVGVGFGNTVILKNGISLPIGRSKKDNFFNELQKYIRSY